MQDVRTRREYTGDEKNPVYIMEIEQLRPDAAQYIDRMTQKIMNLLGGVLGMDALRFTKTGEEGGRISEEERERLAVRLSAEHTG